MRIPHRYNELHSIPLQLFHCTIHTQNWHLFVFVPFTIGGKSFAFYALSSLNFSEQYLTLMNMDKNTTVQGKVMRELDFESYTMKTK